MDAREFKELLDKAKRGCKASLEKLFVQYQPWLKGLARRLARQDSDHPEQDAFVNAQEGLSGLRAEIEPELLSWLETILHSAYFRRRMKRERIAAAEKQAAVAESEGDLTGEAISKKDRGASLAGALASLPEPLREAVKLRFWGSSLGRKSLYASTPAPTRSGCWSVGDCGGFHGTQGKSLLAIRSHKLPDTGVSWQISQGGCCLSLFSTHRARS